MTLAVCPGKIERFIQWIRIEGDTDWQIETHK